MSKVKVNEFSYCAKHRAEHADWLDYKIGPMPIQIVSIGNSHEAVRQRQRARYKDWRGTIVSQQALIEQACRAGRNCSDNGADAFEGRLRAQGAR